MQPQLGPQLDELDSLFSRFDQPPGGQYSGWYQYFDRDIRALLGKQVEAAVQDRVLRQGQPEEVPGARSGAALDDVRHARSPPRRAPPTRPPGAPTPNAERIKFVPGLLATTMRYTNRPSGIQQVISFDRGR